jgi:hypothetical protein
VDGLLGVILGEAGISNWLAMFFVFPLWLFHPSTPELGLSKKFLRDLRLDLSAVAGSALPWQVSQGAVTGSLVLAVLF